MHHSATGRAT
jgi:hypothetical protein